MPKSIRLQRIEMQTQPIYKRTPRIGEMIKNVKTGQRAIVATITETGIHIQLIPDLQWLPKSEFVNWAIF